MALFMSAHFRVNGWSKYRVEPLDQGLKQSTIAETRMMQSPKRVIITVLCLLAAVACYAFGAPAGGALFLVLGMAFEGIFWLSVLRRHKAKWR
jgi:hypothetical protein